MRRPARKPLRPDDLALRSWVVELDPASMHREICARLRARADLVEEAGRRWLLTHHVPGDLRSDLLPPPGLLLMLQRLSITAPLVWAGRVGFLLLPAGSLVGRPPQARPRHVASERESRTRAIIEDFQRRLLGLVFDPLFPDAPRLAQYEWLLERVRGLQEPGVPFRKTLDRLFRRGRTVVFNGRRYTLTKRAEERLPATTPPAEVTRALLGQAWRCDAQAVKERVASWRKERRVAQAWDAWWHWLHAHPERLPELARLLEPLDMRLSAQPVS